MTYRVRELLLLTPMMMLAGAMALEFLELVSWRGWGNLLLPMLSALPILVYLWLERRDISASYRPSRRGQ